MTRTKSTGDLDVGVSHLLRTSEREWRRTGVTQADRRLLRLELEEELHGAEEEGFAATRVLGDDATRGARDWARERGLTGRSPRYVALTATVMTPIAAGLALAGFATAVLHGTDLLIAWSAALAIAFIGAPIVTHRFLSRGLDLHRRRTTRTIATALAVAVGLAALAGRAVAAALNYRLEPGPYVAVVAAVLVVFAACITAARATAVRGPEADLAR